MLVRPNTTKPRTELVLVFAFREEEHYLAHCTVGEVITLPPAATKMRRGRKREEGRGRGRQREEEGDSSDAPLPPPFDFAANQTKTYQISTLINLTDSRRIRARFWYGFVRIRGDSHGFARGFGNIC